MRQQRRAGRTVILRSVTTTEDARGNQTEAPTDATIRGALFEPERTVESVDPDQPPVQLSAFWNLPGVHEVGHDEVIVDGDDTWYVNGEAQVWLDRTKVPVTGVRGIATTPPEGE